MGVSNIDIDEQKARIRAALDVLQNYTTEDGKLDATKLTGELKALAHENVQLIARAEAAEAKLERARKHAADEIERLRFGYQDPCTVAARSALGPVLELLDSESGVK